MSQVHPVFLRRLLTEAVEETVAVGRIRDAAVAATTGYPH